jgi:putative RecB family exonuclease
LTEKPLDKDEKKELAEKLGIRRLESPSSINTYRQCPRKYYYAYIKELETKPSIHLIRGKVVHAVLEDFFLFDIENISESSYEFEFKIILHDLFNKRWKESENELSELGLSEEELKRYFDESKDMLQFWLINFLEKLKNKMQKSDFKSAFKALTPQTEKYYISRELGVHGFIDAIEGAVEDICLMDYKTSKKPILSESYKLQLAIYALMYSEKHAVLPKKVGINFLKFGEQHLDVDKELVEFAKSIIKEHHLLTMSDDINDYEKKESFLCKWRTGQCDFYDRCCKE